MQIEELLAAVIFLESDKALRPWPGRGAQAWLLDSVRRVEPDLARVLHETGSGSNRRPYTVSVIESEEGTADDSEAARLGSDKPRNTSLAPGVPPVSYLSEPSGSDKHLYRNKYMLRITSLSPDLTAILRESVFPSSQVEGVIRLNGVEGQLKGVQTEGHPWSGQSSFEGLARQMLISPEPPANTVDRMKWEFVTPTAFHQNNLVMPLPLPILVFGSLIQAWDQFSPLPLPIVLGDFVEKQVGISRHRLSTRLLKFGKVEQHIGFVGTADYRIVPERIGSSSDEFRQRVRLLALLSQFAFYAGVGIRTTVGMGQVRVNLT